MLKKVQVVFILVTLLLLAIALPVAQAQDSDEPFSDTFALEYPDDWTLEVVDDDTVQLVQEDATITFYSPQFVGKALMDSEAETSLEVLAAFLDTLNVMGGEADESLVEPEGDILAALPFGTLMEGPGVAALLNTDNGVMVAVLEGEDDDAFFEILAANFGVVSPCIVSTSEQYVSVRVGPGTNRGEISDLPMNAEFVVEGKATDNDGNVWYRLNVDEVAPGSGANETWVAASSVDETGDCNAVVDADAPPIIPIVVAPPPASSTGGDAGPAVAAGTSGNGIYVPWPEDWQAQLPASMRARSESSAMYIAMIFPRLVTVESATYVNSAGRTLTRARQRVEFDITVNDRATGAFIAATTLVGGDPPPFPASIRLSASINGPQPTVQDALPFFQELPGIQ